MHVYSYIYTYIRRMFSSRRSFGTLLHQLLPSWAVADLLSARRCHWAAKVPCRMERNMIFIDFRHICLKCSIVSSLPPSSTSTFIFNRKSWICSSQVRTYDQKCQQITIWGSRSTDSVEPRVHASLIDIHAHKRSSTVMVHWCTKWWEWAVWMSWNIWNNVQIPRWA